jgi:hypothetical protein
MQPVFHCAVEDCVRYVLTSVLAAVLTMLGWLSAAPFGHIVALKSLVKDEGKVLAAGEVLSPGERIETDATGEAQIQFKDGTRLQGSAALPGSQGQIVVDDPATL